MRADLIEVFKIVRGFENLDPDRFFQVVGDGARRGHSFKLFKKRYRLDVGKFKFASRVCDEWNRLGDGIVSAGTVNVFKTRLDHHLKNVRGYLLVSNLQTPTALRLSVRVCGRSLEVRDYIGYNRYL